MALENVKANSCAADAPASAMWYPLMLMVFHLGTFSEQYANVSVTSRMDGLGG